MTPNIVRFKKRGNIYVFSELSSTQDKAWELVSDGVSSGSLIIAGVQTAGRGRQGKIWYSPRGSLCFSLVLFPVSSGQSGGITISAARALQLALKSALNLETRLKLPNDLYFQEKKLAGIILEVKQKKAVLGVGLNVNCPANSWPVGVQAVSLKEILNRRVSRCAILFAFLNNFQKETLTFTLFEDKIL
ncbi:MAG: biotin--[acetyl-CoA-carboxylase] ligase [Candidatus Ratteibacteria bacterium]|jgi:BirA family biotin operon repressor/biotin-[acetyl-CoA-carboxylase] ligase